jgi:hypothetical protein
MKKLPIGMLLMMWRIVLPGLILFLFSCTTNQDVIDRLTREYLGRSSDDFFRNYGPPASEFKLSSGGSIYTWHSGFHNVPMPVTTNTQGTASPSGFSAYSTTTGGDVRLFCEAKIVTNEKGQIQDISIRGTVGAWEISRCAEVLR